MDGALSEQIRSRLGELTASERKVARALLAEYPSAGLETVSRLANRAGVSAPTVLRFVGRLGFAGYPQFQETLRAELSERQASPLSLYEAARAAREPLDPLGRALAVLPPATAATLSSLPSAEVDAAVALIGDPERRVTAAGGRFSRVLAHYLVLHLTQLRRASRLLPDHPVERMSAIADLGRRDVVVLFDYRRYEPPTLQIAQRAAGQGAKVVLLTDRWLSPAASVAHVVLPSHVDSPSAYDSFVPSLAVVEVIVAGVLARLGAAGLERLEALEAVGQDLSML